MRRYMIIGAALTLVLALLALGISEPAAAQGAVKPVQAVIVNDQSTPVPVSVVPPTPDTEAVCSFDIGIAFGVTFINSVGSGQSMGLVHCPTGITKVDVRRVVFVPGAQTENVASYKMSFSLSNSSTGLFRQIAYLTDGTPEAKPFTQFVLDTGLNDVLGESAFATSGIPGVALKLSGTVFLIGHPIS